MSVSLQDENNVRVVAGRMGKRLTQEQVEFASDFTTPLISFSNPGTGKSLATVVGLIVTSLFHKIPGSQINAMSFTNAATDELAQKYKDACKSCGITPTVKFNTFHSICLSIVRDMYPNMQVKPDIDLEVDLESLGSIVSDVGWDGNDMYLVKDILDAINTLNSALIFDKRNIELSYKFRKLGRNLEEFQKIRKRWFLRGIRLQIIPRGDIPIYALYTLCVQENIRQKYLSQYKVMVVDEFQDLSLLHLRILSMVTHNLVAIGDMKQQIYAFNGASQQIIEEYKKLYPSAREINLTQSFRCANEIADRATSLIQRNFPAALPFRGVGDGGSIKYVSTRNYDLQQLVSNLKKEQDKLSSLNNYSSYEDSMFLFRNNASAIPIAEELFQQGVRFRMPKFLPIFEMPIFKPICKLIEAALEPKALDKVADALKLLPEFKRYGMNENPLCSYIAKSGKDLFSVNYRFREEGSQETLFAMQRAAKAVQNNESCGRVFNIMLPVYGKYIIENKWWLLPKEKTYYFDLIKSIVNKKTYKDMMAQEYGKIRWNEESMNAGFGVRCFTVHAAKGLEADHIFILDADEGVFPNKSKMKTYIDEECQYEAAKELRNERNLLYVAFTRAKKSCTVFYNDQISALISDPIDNDYCVLDTIYDAIDKNFDDVNEFMRVMNIVPSTAENKVEDDAILESL